MNFKCVLGLVAGLMLVGCVSPRSIVPRPTTEFMDHNDNMLEKGLVYVIDNSDKKVVVPAGFVCDRASIPGPVRFYFERKNRAYQYPAMIHDWLYWNQYPKEKADDIFYNAMKDCGVSEFDRSVIWFGVKMGGNGPWKSNKRNRELGLPRIIPPDYRDSEKWPRSWPQYQKELFSKGITNRNEPRQEILY